jgi:hypothetical protein
MKIDETRLLNDAMKTPLRPHYLMERIQARRATMTTRNKEAEDV